MDNEVSLICSNLIRFDTTNPGRGERPAAEYVAGLLAEAGIEPVVFESAERRTSVVARIPGETPEALLIHGHLDVVPAEPADWRIHPFSGEITGGCVWGRGAVDMKGTLSMTLALVRDWARRGVRPRRDVVLAFLADEEATGEYGSRHAVRRHRELFDGCTEAISESGGYSVELPGARVYPVAVGERGTAWMRLTARGVAGHGSRPPVDNAVAELCHALSRIAAHRWPVRLTPGVAALITSLEDVLGERIDRDRLELEAKRLGREYGWRPWAWTALSAGVLVLAGFLRHQRRLAARGGAPLLDPRPLRRTGVGPGLVACSVLAGCYAGLLFSLSLHLQETTGLDPLRAGLAFVPYAIGFAVMSLAWTRLPPWRHLPAAGTLTFAAVDALLAACGGWPGTWSAPLLMIAGAGHAAGYSPLISRLSRLVGPEGTSALAALNATGPMLASVTAVAVLGGIHLTWGLPRVETVIAALLVAGAYCGSAAGARDRPR